MAPLFLSLVLLLAQHAPPPCPTVWLGQLVVTVGETDKEYLLWAPPHIEIGRKCDGTLVWRKVPDHVHGERKGEI